MSGENTVILNRDVTGVQIPNGNAVTLKKASTVVVTQSLGGCFTVHSPDLGGLYRIAGDDSDALGVEKLQVEAGASERPVEQQIWEILKTCYDPEIPVNIVDLGLIYSLAVIEMSGGRRVDVKMTLTAPGCGMGPTIAADARAKVMSLAGVTEARVEVVWEPPWNPSMITPEGKARLGLDI